MTHTSPHKPTWGGFWKACSTTVLHCTVHFTKQTGLCTRACESAPLPFPNRRAAATQEASGGGRGDNRTQIVHDAILLSLPLPCSGQLSALLLPLLLRCVR